MELLYAKVKTHLIPLTIIVMTNAFIGTIISANIMEAQDIAVIVTAIAVSLPVLWWLFLAVIYRPWKNRHPWKIIF